MSGGVSVDVRRCVCGCQEVCLGECQEACLSECQGVCLSCQEACLWMSGVSVNVRRCVCGFQEACLSCQDVGWAPKVRTKLHTNASEGL